VTGVVHAGTTTESKRTTCPLPLSRGLRNPLKAIASRKKVSEDETAFRAHANADLPVGPGLSEQEVADLTSEAVHSLTCGTRDEPACRPGKGPA
jgi:hypothetical protein